MGYSKQGATSGIVEGEANCEAKPSLAPHVRREGIEVEFHGEADLSE